MTSQIPSERASSIARPSWLSTLWALSTRSTADCTLTGHVCGNSCRSELRLKRCRSQWAHADAAWNICCRLARAAFIECCSSSSRRPILLPVTVIQTDCQSMWLWLKPYFLSLWYPITDWQTDKRTNSGLFASRSIWGKMDVGAEKKRLVDCWNVPVIGLTPRKGPGII